LIIACVGDISKLQLYIWSSYGLLAEIKFFFSLSSPLFFEVYELKHTWPHTTEEKIKLRQESQGPGPPNANQQIPDYYLILSRMEMDPCINLIYNMRVSETYFVFFY
jgi:hypothetical protein